MITLCDPNSAAAVNDLQWLKGTNPDVFTATDRTARAQKHQQYEGSSEAGLPIHADASFRHHGESENQLIGTSKSVQPKLILL